VEEGRDGANNLSMIHTGALPKLPHIAKYLTLTPTLTLTRPRIHANIKNSIYGFTIYKIEKRKIEK
jgi:hypothetical protein